MGQEKCYRITPGDSPWPSTLQKNQAEGVAKRELFSSATVRLREYQFVSGQRWLLSAGTLILVTGGELKLPDGMELSLDDLYWCNGEGESVISGASGATAYVIEPLLEYGRELHSQSIVGSNLPWEKFDDPAGRPTQPVQVLLEGSLSALRTRFDPSYIAGEHWHDFDTLYFISSGRMQFGAEGWFEQGDIRAVQGGHSYGPERPGSEGVEFVLVSLGGPVALHWSDLEPPP